MLVLIVFSFAGGAHAADPAEGKAKATICAACHGAEGVSQTPGTPSLAGQTDAFLQWQLVYFRSGARKNDLMSPVAGTLTDDDVQNLGAYFSALPPPKPPAGALDPALMADGVKVAAKYRCGSCHQQNFAGLEQAARLAAQREEYLAKALRDYKTGARRGGGGAAAMPDVAFPMTEPEIKAMSYYLAHRP